jgi:MFS transporter, DHA1 family, staphyloferrin A biosynthesis exporter
MNEELPPDAKSEKQIITLEKAGDVTQNQVKVGTFTSLRIPNFRLLLTGHMLSVAGQWMQQLTINWLIYNVTGSGTILGSINMVRTVTSLGMIPAGGLLIDRVNRRNLMVISNLWMLIITVALGVLLLTHHTDIYYLFIFAALAGITQTLYNNLRQVAVFDLVPRAITPSAVPLLLTGGGIMRSIGPAVGGYLILWFGPSGNFFIQAGAYALIAITIMQLKWPARNIDTVRSSPLQNIREGIAYVAKERTTRAFMLMGFILPFLTVPISTLLPPIYVKDVFHRGPEMLGIMLAPIGVGGIFGGIFTASISRVERRGVVQLVSLLIHSLCLVAFALSTQLWVAMVFLGLGGFFEAIFLTTNQTLLQLSIPDDLRGRVISIVNLTTALAFLGGMIGGAGSDLFHDPRPITIILAGCAGALSIIIFIFSPTIRNYRMSQGIADEKGK